MSGGPVLDAAWLRLPQTQSVFAMIEAGGYGARAVGGIVRNTLLGLPATDIDIATEARPEDVLRLATAAGLKTVPTGLAHGTVTVIAGGTPHEVTTLRRDVSTDGRHAEVDFTRDWAADAARRDFTINALYCDRHGHVFDPLGGLADLAPLRVRFIGNPGARIEEDYLRILRFFRFSAAFSPGGALDPAGLAACAAHRAGLDRISGERIQVELSKLLAAPNALAVTAALVESGVYAQLFGPHANLADFARLTGIEHHLQRPADPMLRLAALAVAAPQDAARLDARLKLSARDRSRLAGCARLRGSAPRSLTLDAAREMAYHEGPPGYLDAVLLSWAASGACTQDAAYTTRARLNEGWAPPVFPLSGADVLAAGIPAGPRVGAVLGEIEGGWIAAGCVPDRDGLLALLRERVAGTGSRQ
jgi:poly(A) polymerase